MLVSGFIQNWQVVLGVLQSLFNPLKLLFCMSKVFGSLGLVSFISVSTKNHRVYHQDCHGDVGVRNLKLQLIIELREMPMD